MKSEIKIKVVYFSHLQLVWFHQQSVADVSFVELKLKNTDIFVGLTMKVTTYMGLKNI